MSDVWRYIAIALFDWRASATVLIVTVVDTGYGCSGLLGVALNTLLGNSGHDSRLGVWIQNLLDFFVAQTYSHGCTRSKKKGKEQFAYKFD